jgi:capsular polysaccharide transport system permease protein
MVIVLTGIILVMDLQVTIAFPKVLQAFAMLLMLSFGIGVLNCFLISMFPVWQQIWSILTRPLFIISGIFFLIDNLPESYRDILLYNPLAHIIMQMRAGFYPTYDAPLVSATFVYLTALICTTFGLLVLRRYHRTILNER